MMRFRFQFGVSGCASLALLVQRTKGRNVTWDETNLDEYLQGPASSSAARRWSTSSRTRKTGRT